MPRPRHEPLYLKRRYRWDCDFDVNWALNMPSTRRSATRNSFPYREALVRRIGSILFYWPEFDHEQLFDMVNDRRAYISSSPIRTTARNSSNANPVQRTEIGRRNNRPWCLEHYDERWISHARLRTRLGTSHHEIRWESRRSVSRDAGDVLKRLLDDFTDRVLIGRNLDGSFHLHFLALLGFS